MLACFELIYVKNLILNDKVSLSKTTLPSMDFICISRLIKDNVDNKLRSVDTIHKKLLNLGNDVQKKVYKNKIIFNFSEKVTHKQKDVLSLGLHY